MKRWHDDVKVMKHRFDCFIDVRWRKDTDQPLGRFRKRHPCDCGKAKCMICHSEKILKIKTHKDKISDKNFKEQLDG